MSIDGRTWNPAAPDIEETAAAYARLGARLEDSESAAAALEVIDAWDALRRRIYSWSAAAYLRFAQDTEDEAAKAEKQRRDELRPALTDLEVQFKRKLLAHPQSGELRQILGRHAFALWDCDVASFEPAIAEQMKQDSKRGDDYTALMSSARFDMDDKTVNMTGLGVYAESPDRAVRRKAERARWDWFEANGEELDSIFDDLVRIRTDMGRTLGHADFVPLGYRDMHRVDYGPADVERFRAQVLEHVVPLAAELRAQQGERLGVDKLMYWDEPVLDPAGNPRPEGTPAELVVKAQGMFDSLDRESLGAFFALMREHHLMDLEDRPSKAGGGFCTKFPDQGLPFVFANFNGTKHDVTVLTHEIGHAFQGRMSRHKRLLDYMGPTHESAEIHSMALEFLCWPELHRFYGDDAERARRIHLSERLCFLPYGVLVDHFQHLVYGNPDASPADRHSMWQDLERRYLPWRDYGDLTWPAKGGRWQLQRHIYLRPFYYIDYTLALTCALQFHLKAQRDPDAALEGYVALCKRGGEAPFGELLRSAGLRSPFEEGCLVDVVREAREYLL